MKYNVYVYNVDRVCNKKAQDLDLDKIRPFHVLPMFRFYLEQADLFAVFKGAKVKILKSQMADFKEHSIINRQTLTDILSQRCENDF